MLDEDGGLQGVVQWRVPWRKYSFYPAAGCAFEDVCMIDITDLMPRLGRMQKEGIKTPVRVSPVGFQGGSEGVAATK